MVVVTASPRHAAELLETLPTWLPYLQADRVIPLPARETAPYERQSPDPDVIEARLAALDALARRDPIVITDADAVTQATLPAGVSGVSVERGERISRDGVIAALESSGYERATLVMQPSNYAVRGGIIDLWPPGDDAPVRIELFGNDVESLRRFDPATQRSLEPLDRLKLGFARETSAESRARAGELLAEIRCNEDDSEATSLAEALRELADGRHPERGDFWTPFIARGDFWAHVSRKALLILDERNDILERSGIATIAPTTPASSSSTPGASRAACPRPGRTPRRSSAPSIGSIGASSSRASPARRITPGCPSALSTGSPASSGS